MSNQSLFVYDGMRNAASFYNSKADEINNLIKSITARNAQLISSEWNGESALAFDERFRNDHAKKLQQIATELSDISKNLTQLVADRENWESTQAAMYK